MAEKWSNIIQTEDYQKLNNQQKMDLKKRYWTNVITDSPNYADLDLDQKHNLRDRFFFNEEMSASDLVAKTLRESPKLAATLNVAAKLDPFNIRRFILEKLNFDIPGIPLDTKDIYEGFDKYSSELRFSDPAKYVDISAKIGKVMSEFEALPLKAAGIGGTALKFGIQEGIQAPVGEEAKLPLTQFVKQRLLGIGESVVTGAIVGKVGQVITNPLVRVPTLAGGFAGSAALRAPEGQKGEAALESAITVLGFEAAGAIQGIAAKKNMSLERSAQELTYASDLFAKFPKDKNIHQNLTEYLAKDKFADGKITSDPPNMGIHNTEVLPKPIMDTVTKLTNDKGLTDVPTRKQVNQIKKEKLAERFAEAEIRAAGKTGKAATLARKSAMKGSILEGIYKLQDTYSAKDVDNLHQAINETTKLKGGEKLTAADAIDKVFLGQPLAPSDIKLIHRVFGRELAVKLGELSNTISPQKVHWTKKLTFPAIVSQAFRAMGDLGTFGRQTIVYTMNHPIESSKLLAKTAKAMWTKGASNAMDLWIRDLPGAYIGEQHGLKLRDWSYGERAEGFYASEYIQPITKIPFTNKPMPTWMKVLVSPWNAAVKVKDISERAFVLHSNAVRAMYFQKYLPEVEAYYGKKMETAKGVKEKQKIEKLRDNDITRLANQINHATGEGTGEFAEKHAAALSAVFWAPRLTISRLQLMRDSGLDIIDVATGRPNRVTSRIMSKELTNFVGRGLLLMSLAAMAGADIEVDPRSSDFGKIKVGNTRYDIWGGFSSLSRQIAQMITGQRKATISGRISDIELQESLWRFIRGKFSPGVGTFVDQITGQDYVGNPVQSTEERLSNIAKQFTMLVMEDVADAIKDSKSQIIPAAIAADLGFGVTTYPVRPSQEAYRMKEQWAKEYFNSEWDNLGPQFQQLISKLHPEIGYKEQEARLQRDDYDFVGKIIKEQMKAGKKIQKGLSKDIQQEFKLNGISVGGLSRQIGSNWYLSDERYKEYQQITQDLIQNMFGKLINDYKWQSYPPETKQQIADLIITKAKTRAREIVIENANRKDFQHYKEMKK